MKDDPTYQLFNILSRIIIIFSIIVLITGLITKFNQNKPQDESYKMNNQSTITPKQQEQIKVGTIAAELNLKGPFVCQFSSPEATVSGYIKNKAVSAQIQNMTQTINVLLNGDCIYFWQKNSVTGEKLCGLNPYLAMIGTLPLANLIGNNQVTSLLGNFGQNQSISPIKLNSALSILNTCKKEEIPDDDVFLVPKRINFKERKNF